MTGHPYPTLGKPLRCLPVRFSVQQISIEDTRAQLQVLAAMADGYAGGKAFESGGSDPEVKPALPKKGGASTG